MTATLTRASTTSDHPSTIPVMTSTARATCSMETCWRTTGRFRKSKLSVYGYTDINGVPIDNDIYSEDETNAVVGSESHPNTGDSSKVKMGVGVANDGTWCVH